MAELPYQPDPELRAPGLRLPNPLDPVSTLSGASYACALVTGLATLLSEAFPHSVGGALTQSRGERHVPDGRRAWELLASGFVDPPPAASPDEPGPVIDARFMDSLPQHLPHRSLCVDVARIGPPVRRDRTGTPERCAIRAVPMLAMNPVADLQQGSCDVTR